MAKKRLKKFLQAYLDIEKIKLVPSSFDIIGHIAVIEFPDELKKEKRIIAKVMIDVHKNIKTVLEKVSERGGKLRLRKYKFLAGKKRFETIHKEFGCLFKLNPKKVYFSPRELTERQRIAEQIKPKEKILAMFSGINPFPIIISKKQPTTEIIAIEMNKEAVRYAIENLRLNRIKNVKTYCGDVKNILPKLNMKFDRIIMPLPLGAESFLDLALKYIKKNGMIHFYNWGTEDDLFGNVLKILKENARKMKKRYRTINKKKVLKYAPKKWKICLDVLVK